MAEQCRWYVIHTYSGYEAMVKDSLEKLIENNNLQENIFEIKIPTEETLEEKANGKKKIVEREVVAAVKEIITVRSSAILTGVATLKTVKIPGEDGISSGEIQVTLGVSTKTLASAAEAHNMITDSFNSRRTVGEKTNKSNDASANTGKVNSEEINKNKPEVRINKTLF